MTTFTKENVLQILRDDSERRIKAIDIFEPKYEGDNGPIIAEKIWTLLNIKHSTVAYSLFKHLQITYISLDCIEKLSLFISMLSKDFSLGIMYEPDSSLNTSRIHLSNFRMVWCEYDDPAMIHYDSL